MTLLKVDNVSKAYRIEKRLLRAESRHYVLNHLSLQLQQGECIGLVGESGSGKSTLGRILLGLDKPDEGSVVFQEVDLYSHSSKRVQWIRRDLQAVFQDSYHSLNPYLTAGDIIIEPLLNFESLSASERNGKIIELLECVGLCGEDAHKFPHQFSGGQQQRLTIARALALRPKLIVLDEAVSSLDMVTQTKIMKLLIDVKKEFQTSYIFISHDLKATRYISDRIMVMDQGKVVEEINSQTPLHKLEHTASRRLVHSLLPSHPSERKSIFS